MFVRIPRGWEKPEREATDEALFRDRRNLCKAIAAGPILLGPAAALLAGARPAAAAAEADPTADLYPLRRNLRYRLDRPVTDETLATTYNNFYEFGSHKEIAERAQAMKIRPWEVRIDGLVEKPFTIAIDDLIRRMPLEERLYRHRCVEAWAMDVPWSGFALSALVELARPLSSARYVVMETLADKEVMPGLRPSWTRFRWPYIEGLTIEEATNELAFLVTGAYGKPVPKQMGAPLRLATPWKYGFKSIKSIVRFSFSDTRPKTFWDDGREYGFWANVNPRVPHPRWSQATERLLGGGSAKTRIYNGYGEYVAYLYKDLTGEKLFM